MIDISELLPRQLFELHAKVEDRLRELEIIRTANNPIGDLAECLFRRAFDLKPANNSQAHYDAIGPAPDELKYQIKGRRIFGEGSRQLSAIRGLEQAQHFDVLAGVLFNEDYSIYKAALVSRAVLLGLKRERKHISRQEHTNSDRFMLVDDIWKVDGVEDVTAKLQSVWH